MKNKIKLYEEYFKDLDNYDLIVWVQNNHIEPFDNFLIRNDAVYDVISGSKGMYFYIAGDNSLIQKIRDWSFKSSGIKIIRE